MRVVGHRGQKMTRHRVAFLGMLFRSIAIREVHLRMKFIGMMGLLRYRLVRLAVIML